MIIFEFIRLLERPRRSVSTEMTEFNWDPMFAQSEGFVKSFVNDIYGKRAIFPMHNTLKTQSNYDTNFDFMRLHCKQLHEITVL